MIASEEVIDGAVEELEFLNDHWKSGSADPEAAPNITHSAAREFARLARVAGYEGSLKQAQDWYGIASEYVFQKILTRRNRRDIRDRIEWKGEPSAFFSAVNYALLSRNEELLIEIATEAIAVDDHYLDEFADDYPDSPANFYDMKVHAALVLEDDRAARFLEGLETAIQVTDERSRYWNAIPEYYRALLEGSDADAEAALSELFEFFADETPDPDDPSEYVLDEVCAYIVLARRYGLDVSIDSDRLPDALLREDIPDEDGHLDVDVSDLQFTSRVGMFELERDDDGVPVIAGRIYHPGGGPVSADDVPEREAGRILSDEWVDAALDEATWRDHYDDDLAKAACEAHEEGTLKRKLVVVQDRTDGHTFDETLTELPVDDVQMLKGAGRRN